MNLLPVGPAKELKTDEFMSIPSVNVKFRHKSDHYFEISFLLTGKKIERAYYFVEGDYKVARVFPEKSYMALKESGVLEKQLRLRIQIGRSSRNDLGYYARFELLIDNAERNVISGILPDEILEFVADNYKSMSDYLIWLHGTTADDIKKAIKEKGEN